jgi:hypothetical protein
LSAICQSLVDPLCIQNEATIFFREFLDTYALQRERKSQCEIGVSGRATSNRMPLPSGHPKRFGAFKICGAA